MSHLSGSAERVVLPVPDKPKNKDTSPSAPALAAQCIGNTSASGNIKFITPNIDFFISPAYAIPRIRTFFSLKLTMIAPSEFVPCSSGLHSKFGNDLKVHTSFLAGLNELGFMNKL